MFGLVGRIDVVPEAYRRYVCQGVTASTRDTLAAKRQAATNEASELSDFFYINLVIGLFRNIANIVEEGGKLVASLPMGQPGFKRANPTWPKPSEC